jgi:hypothetical protein
MFAQNPSRDITFMKYPFLYDLLEHMCLVFAPWPDSIGSLVEQRLFCSTYLHTAGQHTPYTRETFLQRIINCRIAIPHST